MGRTLTCCWGGGRTLTYGKNLDVLLGGGGGVLLREEPSPRSHAIP